MKKYYVGVSETRSKAVGVIAKDKYEAIEKVNSAYKNGGIYLDSEDIIDAEITIEDDQEYYTGQESQGVVYWQEIE